MVPVHGLDWPVEMCRPIGEHGSRIRAVPSGIDNSAGKIRCVPQRRPESVPPRCVRNHRSVFSSDSIGFEVFLLPFSCQTIDIERIEGNRDHSLAFDRYQ